MGRSRRRLCVSLILFVYFNALFLYHVFPFTRLILILLCPILKPPSIIWGVALGSCFAWACMLRCLCSSGVLRILTVWKTGVAIPSIFANSSSVPCTSRFGLHFTSLSTFHLFLIFFTCRDEGGEDAEKKRIWRSSMSPRPKTSVQRFRLVTHHQPAFKKACSRLRYAIPLAMRMALSQVRFASSLASICNI